MAQETEIEKKNLLTESEFHNLCKTLNIKMNDFFWQANTYFDTTNDDIKKQGAALRVRQKNDAYELTLKQPAEVGLLETNQNLTKEEAKLAFSTFTLPEGEVKHQLISSLAVDVHNLHLLGTLETNRVQTPFNEGLLFLDKSVYLDTEDFEIELEGPAENVVETWMDDLLKEHGIPVRETPNKIKRFFLRKQELEGENNL
ncbi:CYTH domain-containing protein [Salibacterium salarium]|uniref:CYTH domain-containing protein n=1 Tax=Salibacterium salarium TaxID=284579 RepID=A0A3R9QHY6_9BACI|nr:CYTH domain-containing protein [Salibacterium salarium]RSL31045.1 CYTH domain-containing protein [Salibacterium salarium]